MEERGYLGVLYNGILKMGHFAHEGKLIPLPECHSLDEALEKARSIASALREQAPNSHDCPTSPTEP